MSVSAIAAKQITSQSTDQEIVKNWTQQIAQLEVKQALLEPIFTPDAPQFAQLIREQANLKESLAQLQPDTHQTQVVAATTNALESQLIELEVKYAQDKATYTDDNPLLQRRKAQINILRQRLMAL